MGGTSSDMILMLLGFFASQNLPLLQVVWTFYIHCILIITTANEISANSATLYDQMYVDTVCGPPQSISTILKANNCKGYLYMP